MPDIKILISKLISTLGISLLIILAPCCTGHVQGAHVSAELKAALTALSPDEKLAVLINFPDKTDCSRVGVTSSKKARLKKVITLLQATAEQSRKIFP